MSVDGLWPFLPWTLALLPKHRCIFPFPVRTISGTAPTYFLDMVILGIISVHLKNIKTATLLLLLLLRQNQKCPWTLALLVWQWTLALFALISNKSLDISQTGRDIFFIYIYSYYLWHDNQSSSTKFCLWFSFRKNMFLAFFSKWPKWTLALFALSPSHACTRAWQTQTLAHNKHKHAHTHTHTQMHACRHTHMHGQTHGHTHIHIYIKIL
mgnify:CR=1 FL=1